MGTRRLRLKRLPSGGIGKTVKLSDGRHHKRLSSVVFVTQHEPNTLTAKRLGRNAQRERTRLRASGPTPGPTPPSRGLRPRPKFAQTGRTSERGANCFALDK